VLPSSDDTSIIVPSVENEICAIPASARCNNPGLLLPVRRD
jgi:hypothetical protein